MTPEHLAALATILTILKNIGVLPLSVVSLLFFGPWITLIAVLYSQGRRADKTLTTFQESVGTMQATMAQQDTRINEQIVGQNDRLNKMLTEQNVRVNDIILDFRDRTGELITGQEKRFEAVVRMYENNVEMVRDYHKLADDLTGVITLTTRTLEALVQKVDNNMFCPAVREKGGR
ncbi:hypothetical protein HTZ97_16300 [Desulfuromonas acetoxidans]|uniref:Uncharacterized protein n=1 Tax=Desulfuromonas acetoxidans (strain DSM 684 / 11070) TaxID=281689 RepID=Q1K064_DESA6|nr:hypothetical protein [Desulfuromonas acetoxidans]EAT16077.1 hypothetical protein Dace_2378 [Desulfuromonas acetoxidans DSM 684]MBF0646893.1 hypothetical protein [Desulfuromonas acetoxidans]NVD26170.1 hypothetical protein [Desulfuromonas acetoxidans]NVE18018.1 hypothetical protein [Desulfuromonas acetoxidans]